MLSNKEPVSDEEYEERRRQYYPMDPKQGEPAKNARGNYCVEEVVHHGNYRHVRIVEVATLDERTVGAIVRSGPYVYNAADDSPQVAQILTELKLGRVNRSHGWSTFRVVHLNYPQDRDSFIYEAAQYRNED